MSLFAASNSCSVKKPEPIPEANCPDGFNEEHVELYLYDLADEYSLCRVVSMLASKDVLWHSCIVVYGKAYSFNNSEGIQVADPEKPRKIISIGYTKMNQTEFHEVLKELKKGIFCHTKYNAVNNNCHTFSDEIARVLTGEGIPQEYVNMGESVQTNMIGNALIGLGAIGAGCLAYKYLMNSSHRRDRNSH